MSKSFTSRGIFIPDGYSSRLEALMGLIRFGPEAMPKSEFLALLFHAERSVVYGKSSDAASLTQMTKGVWIRKNGERIRGAAGISKAGCAAANASLEMKGLIKRIARHRENGACDATEYEIQWSALTQLFVKTVPPNKRDPCLFNGQTPVQPMDSPPVQQPDSPCRETGQQQSRSYRDHHQQRRVKQSAAVPKGSGVVGKSKSLPQPEEPASPISLKADDEKPATERRERLAREPAPTPEKELRLRLEERHGKQYPESVREMWIADVTRDLHGADLPLEEFLELDQLKTTNPAGVLSPPAYYRDLVKQLVTAGKVAALESRLAIDLALKGPSKPEPKCERCRAGRLSFENDDDPESYCPECQLGRELRHIQQRKTSPQAAEGDKRKQIE